jgi:hypothetical protein
MSAAWDIRLPITERHILPHVPVRSRLPLKRRFSVPDMKTRLFTSITIFVSSYSPLAVILLIKDFNLAKRWFDHPRTCLIVVIVAISSLILLLVVLKLIMDGGFSVSVKKLSNRSNELVNYTIPYMISPRSERRGKLS